MRKVTLHEKTIWVGTHPKIGLFIYDKERQDGAPSETVKLFSIKKKKMGTYLKEIVTKNIRVIDDELYKIIEPSINKYFDLQNSRRDTQCFKCKRLLNSLDYPTCPQCRWIKCKCGGCGCVPGWKAQ
jgi:hypothetical protein